MHFKYVTIQFQQLSTVTLIQFENTQQLENSLKIQCYMLDYFLDILEWPRGSGTSSNHVGQHGPSRTKGILDLLRQQNKTKTMGQRHTTNITQLYEPNKKEQPTDHNFLFTKQNIIAQMSKKKETMSICSFQLQNWLLI